MTFIVLRHCSYFPPPAAMMKLRRTFTIVLAISGYTLIICNAVAQEACKLTAIGPVNIAVARDGCALVLEDGRELQLAAIEAGDKSRDA
jgi:hypothetical protein